MPTTADGKVITEQQTVWWWDGNVLLEGEAFMDIPLVFVDPNDPSMAFSPNDGIAVCYSTQAAALAARKESDEMEAYMRPKIDALKAAFPDVRKEGESDTQG